MAKRDKGRDDGDENEPRRSPRSPRSPRGARKMGGRSDSRAPGEGREKMKEERSGKREERKAKDGKEATAASAQTVPSHGTLLGPGA